MGQVCIQNAGLLIAKEVKDGLILEGCSTDQVRIMQMIIVLLQHSPMS